MSGNVRARRPASPPPGLTHAAPTSQRFPHPRRDHLDADERKEAASRGYRPGRKSHFTGGLSLTSAEWKLLLLVVLVASGVRLFRLSRPNSVVFDEVHFGKFASRYIKSQYFVDVHPPLAKLLITLAGWTFGYDGNFDFKDIAKVYERVPYVAMRMVPATLGIATVPLAYLTLRALDCRATSALLASLLITFENGLITQSRHILLDSPLIFFTALTVFSWTGFCNEDNQEPFTESWWTWLVLSGLSLGAVVSCKWVGLFTIATVGLGTLKQLWLLLGDIRVPPRLFIKHFLARALCLIAIPILFYMSMFGIHLLILSNSGEGDGFMSSEFQHTLNGRGMADTFADVAVGSEVTIRHVNTQGGYLHSHPSVYPGGSKQQQVTLYPHRDSNNDWRILNASMEVNAMIDWQNQPLEYVTSGMRIRLRHLSTNTSLHSHDVRPPVSDVDFQQEVSAYGHASHAGDANDDWIVEIDKGDRRDKESSKRLRTLRTHFKLKHAMTGCYLFSHKVKLPEWGFEQQEVTCNKQAVKENSLWFIETATHPKLPPDAPKVNYKLPGFLAKFVELQKVMWTTNAGLTDRHTFDSRPDAWPRLLRGINFWVKDHRQIYLLGNPMIWWLSTAAVFTYMAVRGFLILRAKRGYRDFENTKLVKYDTLCGFLFVGWFLHYFPFYLMGRQLFLHHYFPALYFAILLSCGVFDLVTSTLRPRVRLQIAAVLLIIAIWNYSYFSPLAYGLPWTKAKCNRARWLKTWDFSCNDFLDNYSDYNSVVVPTPQREPISVGGEGRGAVVINEKPVEVPAEPSAETSIAFGQAEPGRDIFAGHPHDDIMSKDKPQPVVEKERQEKEISSMNGEETTTIAPESSQDVSQTQVEESSSPSEATAIPSVPTSASTEEVLSSISGQSASASAESTSTDSSSTESTSTQSSTSLTEAADEGVTKSQGPKPEDEAEADRARKELFPETSATDN